MTANDNKNRDRTRPVDTLRDGALKLAIFRNQRESGVSYSARPARIYTDDSGKVQETGSLSGSELIRMSRLLEKGYDRIAEMRQQQKSTRRDRER